MKPKRNDFRLKRDDLTWAVGGSRYGQRLMLEHLPTGVQVFGEIPWKGRAYSRKEAQRSRRVVFRALWVQLEEEVAWALRLPGIHSAPPPASEMEPRSLFPEPPQSGSRGVEGFRHERFRCPDSGQAGALADAMAAAGLRAVRDEDSVLVIERAPTSRDYRRIKAQMVRAAQRSGAEWVLHSGSGPRQGSRGAFTTGATNRARARRRGKTSNRRRARHAAAQALRTGFDRPARIQDRGARMPKQMQAPLLDADDLDSTHGLD